MQDQSQKSQQKTFWDTDKSICSVESPDGQKHLDSLDFLQDEKFGLLAAPVSRSRSRGKAKPKTTRDTYGQKHEGSSPSAILQSCLASRLKARLDLNGSPEYVLTWKSWGMLSGPAICALRASPRRTGDSEYTLGLFGWPTPNTMPDAPNMSENRGDGHRQRITPQSVAGLVGWPTPRTATGGPESSERKKELGRTNSGGSDLESVCLLTGWGTPRVTTNGGLSAMHGIEHNSRLEDQVHLTGWATASARDWKDTPGMNQHGTNPDGSARARLDQLPRQVHGLIPTSSTASTGRKGVLAPQMSRWLQGFPAIWDSLSPMYENWQQVQDAIARADCTATEIV